MLTSFFKKAKIHLIGKAYQIISSVICLTNLKKMGLRLFPTDEEPPKKVAKVKGERTSKGRPKPSPRLLEAPQPTTSPQQKERRSKHKQEINMKIEAEH